MKKTSWVLLSLTLAIAAIGFVMLTGCEDTPSTDVNSVGNYSSTSRLGERPRELAITIDPSTVDYIGQQIELNVVNGDTPFSWSLEDDTAGTIDTMANTRQAIYTATTLTPNTVFVTDVNGRSGWVVINTANSATLTIIPSSQTFTSHFSSTNDVPPTDLDGAQINFRVEGGVPPYGTWQVATPFLGTIDANTGVYTVDGTQGIGDNVVSITDSAGNIGQATVTTKFKN